MKRRSQSILKWSCTLLTGVLLIVWLGSAWWVIGLRWQPAVNLDVLAGRISIEWEEPWSIIPVDGSWVPPQRHPVPFLWWFDGWRVVMGGVTYTGVSIPIWSLVILTMLPTSLLWYRDRRRAPGLCPKCGYDLRGTNHEACPECGSTCKRAAPVK